MLAGQLLRALSVFEGPGAKTITGVVTRSDNTSLILRSHHLSLVSCRMGRSHKNHILTFCIYIPVGSSLRDGDEKYATKV